MKMYYDQAVGALYLKLSDREPDGVIEIAEGINVDTTSDGKPTGINILKASGKMDLDTILSYNIQLNRGILKPESVR